MTGRIWIQRHLLREEDHVTTKAEMGGVSLQAKGHQGVLAVTGKWKKQGRTLPKTPLQEKGPANTNSIELPAPELGESHVLWFKTTQVGAVCCGNLR